MNLGGMMPIFKSLQKGRRIRQLSYLLFALLFIAQIAFSGCSHTTAYIRPGVPAQAEPAPSEEDVIYRLILIGDAGEPAEEPAEPVLKSLRERVVRLKDRTSVIFLGDNIYPAGLPAPDDPKRPEMQRKLQAQIDAVKNSGGAKAIFVPGNHDWNRYGEGGQAALARQQEFVENELGDGAFLPTGGCPGPVKIDFDSVRLIVLDTQWWLHEYEKPISECFEENGIATEQQAKDRLIQNLTDLIESAGNRKIVVAAHHPLDTHGPHGGFFDWKDHIFPLTELVDWLYIPLPVVGSIYPLIRWYVVKSDQDLSGSQNKAMVQRLQEAISHSEQPVIYAAGHDHALQVLEGKDKTGLILVSGLGSAEKASKVGHGKNTLFAYVQPGFMELDFLVDGNVYLRVIEQDEKSGGYSVAFSYWVAQ
jgi:hypothetical protein